MTAIETYDQALNWLGAERDYADDAIPVLHTTKVNMRHSFTCILFFTSFL